jgi:hypothetical protein
MRYCSARVMVSSSPVAAAALADDVGSVESADEDGAEEECAREHALTEMRSAGPKDLRARDMAEYGRKRGKVALDVKECARVLFAAG